LHTWSLAVEEQFYLIWPLIILLVKKPKILLWIVFVLLIGVGVTRYIVWSYQIKDLAYAGLYTFTRIDGICIGCMLAIVLKVYPGLLKKYTALIVLLMAAINFAFYFIDSSHAHTLPYLAIAGYTTFAVLFGLLVYEGIRGDSKIIRFLFDNRPLKFFGKISYGLYVYHWPVYVLFFYYFRSRIINGMNTNTWVADLFCGIIVTIIAIVISVLSYRYFEKPFLKLKERFS
jgi:peptidoglycan/LPS O-acetylase OafA/YrhL